MKRILSIDALRGFDMMWITGMGKFLLLAGTASGTAFGAAVANQMEHVPWDGLHLMDLVFPTFIFLAGASWPFSLGSQRAKGRTDREIFLKILERFLVLFAFGLVYDSILGYKDCGFNFKVVRFNSVLGRIGFGWAVAAAVSLFCRRKRTVAIVAAASFFGYWALCEIVPRLVHPGASVWMPRENTLCYMVDEWLTPGRLVGIRAMGHEGFFSSLGCIPSAFLGLFAGWILANREATDRRKSLLLLLAAVALGAAGGLALLVCPCIKPVWNPTYILLSGAIAFFFLWIFHLVIDIGGYVKWCFYFQVIGMNSITIYMLHRLVDLHYTSRRFFSGLSFLVPPAWHDVVIEAGVVVIGWLILYFLYRKKIFLKV